MTSPLHILADDGRCEIGGRSIGVTPVEADVRTAIGAESSRELDKHGEFNRVKFERRSVLYDDLGICFCYTKRDGKVIWLMADLNRADWRRNSESDLESCFEGQIRIGPYTVNRSIRWSTFDETVETSLRDISIHAAPCDSGMISGITIGFPQNEGEQVVDVQSPTRRGVYA